MGRRSQDLGHLDRQAVPLRGDDAPADCPPRPVGQKHTLPRYRAFDDHRVPGLVPGHLHDPAYPHQVEVREEERVAHPKVSLNQPLTPL